MSGGAGRIYFRGKFWWCAYYRHGHEIRESTKTASATLARKFLQKRIESGRPGREERIKFEDLAACVIRDYQLRELKTIYDLEKVRLPHLRAAFSGLRAVDITTARIRNYTAARKSEGAAAASINRELGVLKRGFKLAVQDGMLGIVPHVPMLPETTVREGFVSHAQFRAIAAELPASELRDVAEFLYLTGWRLREALTLEWRDLDLEHGTIRLRAAQSKTGRGRAMKMGVELAAIARRRKLARRMDCRFVFHREGKMLVRGSVSRAWRRAAARAGQPGIMVHDLRRTAARNLIRSGVQERVVMAILGHRTRSMLDRYNISSDEDLARAQDRLSEYLNLQPTALESAAENDAVKSAPCARGVRVAIRKAAGDD